MLNTLRRVVRFARIIKKIPDISGAWYIAKKPSKHPIDYNKISWTNNQLYIKKANISLSQSEFSYFFNEMDSLIYFFEHASVKREGKNLIATVMGKDKEVNILVDCPEVVAVINELFLEEEYRVDSKEEYIVIDIGMNVGLATLYFASSNQVKKIFSFEPFLETFQSAVRNFSLNPELNEKIVPEQAGLGKLTETLKVPFDSESVLTSSTTGIVGTKAKTWAQVNILNASTAIRHIIDTHSSKYKILLKVDCEGAEYEIIEDLQSTGLLQKIDVIVMEWHVKGAKPILDVLNSNNFVSFTRKLPHDFPIGLIYATRLGKSQNPL